MTKKPVSKKKTNTRKAPSPRNSEVAMSSEPKYPYCTTPKSLRRFLELAPNKPRPPKINGPTLKVWGLKNNNDMTIIRVLKSLNLLTAGGETTTVYADYMKKDTGPAALGRQIRTIYSGLFESVTKPEHASNEELQNFFNIHSGGSEGTVRFQIETFKALAAFATFGESDPLEQPASTMEETRQNGISMSTDNTPAIRIDLHIHLPENKTKSDYDAILESIATHIYRRTS